ncbi:MAG: ADP-ribosylation factor-like protein [Candidatus Hodarchaeota archaeon]
MSEWVSDAEVTARLGYKILIAGLSEAGKTAVKRIFFLKQTTKDVDSLSATINYERLSVTISDTPVTIVDLGGQKIFLKRFLSGFSPFIFSSVQVFIYLIDVANKTSRNNSIEYFRACLEKLREFSPEAELFVFLHKNDLVRNNPNYESIHEQLKEQFQLETDKRLKFFRTTIYKPESVIDSFGRIFELIIPTIAGSAFVDERTIGEIEEHHLIDMTLREPVPKVEATYQSGIDIITPKIAGDTQVLEKLQFLMREATKTQPDFPTQADQKQIFLGNAATEELSSEAVLTHFEAPKPIESSISNKTEFVEPPKEPTPAPLGTASQESSLINQRISHIDNFYRIGIENATEIVNSGFSNLFEIAAKIGIPIPLISDIILKYIPFLKNTQSEAKYATLNEDRLLDMLNAHLKGFLNEKDIVQCLVIMLEKNEMPVHEIVKKYFAPEKKKKELKVKKPVIEKEVPQYAKIDIPVEAESIEGIITLPQVPGMGFKVDLIEPDALNARITFHLQGPLGQRELIGSSIVSAQITTDELLYLLAYELNMSSMGLFEDGVSAMYFAAKIIHESIRQLHQSNLRSTSEIKAHVLRKSKGKIQYRAGQVDFIIPTEVQMDGDFILIPDSENVAFKVEKADKGITIKFFQRGFPIGEVNVIESIGLQQLHGLLQKAMQLPIESEGAIDFASRIIHSVISKLAKPEEVLMPKTSIKTSIDIQEEDESSEQLKSYLALLDED